MVSPLEEDLKRISEVIEESVLKKLSGKNIFLTGGTGFFGVWLLEWFRFANRSIGLNVKVTVLTRNAERFNKKIPHLFNEKAFSFLIGDVKDFEFPKEKFDFVIHAATEASETLNDENPTEMIDSIVVGTRRTLDFAVASGISRMLYVSSGAVYGKQSSEISHLEEDCLHGPDVLNPRNAYAESKRMAELLCGIYARTSVDVSVARCFAFVGPHLNLDIHFAIGNFIRNGLEGRPIEIKGDGTPLRSYMYSADLVVWLLTILINGKTGEAYNVGSDQELSIHKLANKISSYFQNLDVVVKSKPNIFAQRESYVPSIEKVKKELNLKVNFDLDTAICKTIEYYKSV